MNRTQSLLLAGLAILCSLILIGGGVLFWNATHASHVNLSPPPEVNQATAPAPVEPVTEGIAADVSHLPLVYASNFSNGADSGWSDGPIEKTPKTGSRFLGQFCNEKVSLTVHSLPAHDRLHLTCKLYIINTWDGIAPSNGGGRIGPDYWSLDLHDGPNLIRSTFSNTTTDRGFAYLGRFQNYPHPIPSDPVMLHTGASGDNSLGYIFTFKYAHVSFPMDSVYDIDITLPHSASSVQFDFAGAELQDISDEGWGLADVKIEAMTAVESQTLDRAAMDAKFSAVVGDDAVAANHAFWELVTLGDDTAEYIARTISTLDIDLPKARQALADLQATPAAHDAAATTLIGTGPAIEPLMRAAVVKSNSEDLADDVLKINEAIVIRPIQSIDRRRGAAAVRLLDVINTPRSKAVLDALYATATTRPTVSTDDDWKAPFAQVYTLPKDQVLKYIPPPLIPGGRGSGRPGWRIFTPSSPLHTRNRGRPRQIAFTVRDEVVDLNSGYRAINWPETSPGHFAPPPGLTHILDVMGGNDNGRVYSPRVIVPREMENVVLPGDWITRFPRNQEKILSALGPILKEQAGRSIHFVKKTVPQDIFRVKGNYAFKPIVDGQKVDKLLVIAGSADNLGPEPRGVDAVPLSFLWDAISRTYHVQIIDETRNRAKISFRFYPTALPPEEMRTTELLKDVLANLSKQTSLEFGQERGTLDEFTAVEDAVQVEKP